MKTETGHSGLTIVHIIDWVLRQNLKSIVWTVIEVKTIVIRLLVAIQMNRRVVLYVLVDFPQVHTVTRFIASEPDELDLEEADVVSVYQRSPDGGQWVLLIMSLYWSFQQFIFSAIQWMLYTDSLAPSSECHLLGVQRHLVSHREFNNISSNVLFLDMFATMQCSPNFSLQLKLT